MAELKALLLDEKVRPACIPDWFAQLGSSIIREHDLLIAGTKYTIVELEFYLYSGAHPDPYVHKSDAQLSTSADWYFHREKSASLSFTLKGLDLTFGVENKEYGGILLRALRDSATGKFVEGPSKVVDTILTLNGVRTVTELKAKEEFAGDAIENPALSLHRSDAPRDGKIIIAPRFGLSAKKGANDYFAAAYRFRAYPDKTTKGKQFITAGTELVMPVWEVGLADAQLTDEEFNSIMDDLC